MRSNEIKKNPLFYIQHLNEKSRLKRTQTSLNESFAARQENFQVFFSGANETRTQQKLKRCLKNSKSPYIRKIEVGNSKQSRKRWDVPKTPDMLKERNLNIQTTDVSPVERLFEEVVCEGIHRITVEELALRASRLCSARQEELIRKLEELENISMC